MTASRCLHHAIRIGSMPLDRWASEVKALPEQCGNDDCTTGNCREVVREYLKTQWAIRRNKRNFDRSHRK